MIVKLRKVKNENFTVNVPRKFARIFEERNVTHFTLSMSEDGTLTYRPVSAPD